MVWGTGRGCQQPPGEPWALWDSNGPDQGGRGKLLVCPPRRVLSSPAVERRVHARGSSHAASCALTTVL